MKINQDAAELLFRVLFSLIFLGLGGEHIFSDSLIQHLMPAWVPMKRLVSLGCGIWLVVWGAMIFLGYAVRRAAIALGAFVVLVTLAVHAPGVFARPEFVSSENEWMWQILQRSNLAKNLCLLGVCFHLLYHEPRRYSVSQLFRREGR